MIETEMILLDGISALRMWEHLARTQLANIIRRVNYFHHLKYLKIGDNIFNGKRLGLYMGKKNSVPILFGLLMIFSTFSGCLGDDFLQSTDKKGIPGGLTLACLSSAEYTSMIVEIDYDSGYILNRVLLIF